MIGAFEGGFYTQFGVYRPSENSLMKALRREFNAVSREKMIQSFYTIARPIDAASPPGGSATRDGVQIPQWNDRASVDLNGAIGSATTLTVVVSDPTTWVRDAAGQSRGFAGKIPGVMYRFCGCCGTEFVDQSWPRLCAGCGQYTYRGPKPLVKAVVPVVGGRLMVARRNIEPGKGGLELPGGHMELGETWQEGMVRELREETGLIFEPGDVTLHSVRSIGEFVTVFGLLPEIVDLPTVPTEEASEFLAIDRWVEMEFPSHNALVAEYFATDS
ncbi:MAG TPA: NUDIX domain-containing protein [Candidatus Limnocylindrales bacterium]